MSAAQKATWETNAKASGLKLSGYHYFLRTAQRDLYTHHGLLTYWHMNEIVGGKCKDLSGAGLDLTLGSPYPTNAPLLVASKTAKYGNCLHYDVDGKRSDRSVPDIWKLGTGDFSLCITFYWETSADYDTLLRWYNWIGWVQGLLLATRSGNYFYFTIGDDTANDTTGWFTVPLNAWTDLVITRTSGNVRIYINGAATYGPFSMPRNFNNNTTVMVGCETWTNDRRFPGKLDEFCFYNRALSAAEIKTRQKFNDNK